MVHVEGSSLCLPVPLLVFFVKGPSPRSSLTMTMFTEAKATFVRRTLAERVIPITQSLIRLFGPDVEARCIDYVQKTYQDELPAPDKPTTQDASTTTAV